MNDSSVEMDVELNIEDGEDIIVENASDSNNQTQKQDL